MQKATQNKRYMQQYIAIYNNMKGYMRKKEAILTFTS